MSVIFNRKLRLLLLAILLSGWSVANSIAEPHKKNILFIAVDDLRPELGCYGANHIKSPHIDALAASGQLFERAYCQQAVCNPSRTSLMTGKRPEEIGVTGNHVHFRSRHPEVVTLPQHFKNHGYHTAAIGKIYHGVFPDGASKTKWDTMGDPESWSVPATRFGPRYYYTEKGIQAAKQTFERIYQPRRDATPDAWTRKLVFGLATESPDVPDEVFYDGKVAEAAVDKLRKLGDAKQPFFLAVGFIKPHSPYVAPKKYFDLYDDIALADQSALPDGAPSFAGHNSGELRRYTDQPSRGPISAENQRRVRHAYYACISYIDAQIGKILEELDSSGLSESTTVVLWGDHGYHLGEQGLWGKTTNFELDTRVPLIVREPGMKAAGTRTSSLVELVDLYPTLVDLVGLPSRNGISGQSFRPILNDPEKQTKSAAFSQYPRGGGLMGYSMRTDKFRLTHWIHLASDTIRATELYEYSNGLVEEKNLAATRPELVEQLTVVMRKQFPIPIALSHEFSNAKIAVLDTESFEKAKPGTFDKLASRVGVWSPEVGRTIVDDKHAKSGKQCLQLTGGRKNSVRLKLPERKERLGTLSFWAERWTSRNPFTFRIEQLTDEGWKEIYDGDSKVRVGRSFLNHVQVPLGDESVSELRFTVSSPANTGILIDDIRFAKPRKQEVVKVEALPFTLPALVGAEASCLAKLRITASGSLQPILLNYLNATITGLRKFKSLQLEVEGRQAIVPLRLPASQESSIWNPGVELQEGENIVWLKGTLKTEANIDGVVGATLQEVGFSNGKKITLNELASKQRMGVAVRQAGDEGIHTFRIPGLATTNVGTLIGVYDVRRRGGGDLPGDIDVGMSRSTDGGRTWEPMRVIMDMGNDPRWRYDGIGDPAILVDKNTGTIWVAATWSHGNRSWRGSGPGLTPEETGQLMLVRSDDDGITWSEPINITEQVKKPEWCFILQGPGKGITMRDGTIVFAAQYQDPPDKQRLPHSTIIFSKDHGKTWEVGSGAFDDTTESQVVEVEPGILMLNCRYNRKPVRVVMTSNDMGTTWQRHSTSERALIEPGACMASLIDVDQELGQDAGNWLLFSNPDSTRGRSRIMIKASPDRGMTWPKQHRLLLDEQRGAGYSCMSMIDDDTVGILYEGSQAQMTFQRIPLADVLGDSKLAENEIRDSNRKSEKDTRALHPQPKLTMPRVFGSHMVLQADLPIRIWGTAIPDGSVLVRLGQESQQAHVDGKGNWNVRFQQRTASATPIAMSVHSADESLHFEDIVLGEVWVCAGQSNMEWMLQQSANAEDALRQAEQADLRLLKLNAGARGSSGVYGSEQIGRLSPNSFFEGAWQTASPASASTFSAVGWYFGRLIQESLGVPVGLICPAVGGTPTEAWIPKEALANDTNMRGLVAGNWLDNSRLGEFCRTRGEQNLLTAIQTGLAIPGDELGPNHSFKPGFMWEAGIEPMIPFAIRGVIWYQGESNAETRSRVFEHDHLFTMLVDSWRSAWNQEHLPFITVQLPALGRPHWPLFRDRQRRLLDRISDLGMAITIDTGHRSNVHPALKEPVGERLATWALGTTYKTLAPNETYSGPLIREVNREENAVIISFDHVGEGLKSLDDKPLRHFEVSSRDGVFHPAQAKIIDSDTVSVSSAQVTEPIDVRYAWQPYPDPSVNIFNSVDLPASPFTTEKLESSNLE